VALPDELLGQVRDDALGAAVGLRRDALVERRHLGNSHGVEWCAGPMPAGATISFRGGGAAPRSPASHRRVRPCAS
jgi:hypothetical protein